MRDNDEKTIILFNKSAISNESHGVHDVNIFPISAGNVISVSWDMRTVSFWKVSRKQSAKFCLIATF